MSVIFKTLKKLNTKSTENENSKNILARRKKVYFSQNSLCSPSRVVLLLLLLTVVGAGTLYGYYHLREARGENTKDIDGQNTELRQLKDEDTSDGSDINGTKNLSADKSTGSSQIEYLAPETNDDRVKVYGFNPPDNVERPFIASKEASPEIKKPIKTTAVTKTKVKKESKPLDVEVSPIPKVETIFLANAKKNAKIASLVADIHWEMEHGDKIQTEKYIDELAALKGQNNSYVLKLKAVWHIHNNEYARAEDLLKTVLTKNELDQEAGINMAIIEIKKQHIQKAYERLQKLRTIYPENIRIAEILQNMNTNTFRNRHFIRDKKS